MRLLFEAEKGRPLHATVEARRALSFPMSTMKRFHAGLALLLLMAALMSTGCASNSNNANAAAGQNSAQSNTARTTTTTTTTTSPAPQSNTAQATPQAQSSSTPAATGVESDALPVTDAAAFRDRLLEIARSARATSQTAYANGEAIRNAWQTQYPNLKFSIFYSMAADANTVSASDAFLISGLTGNFDQLYAFAVADTRGRCAGGAIVIPGDNANRKVSDEKMPTVFKPIDMSNAKSCSGDAAGKNYKP